MSKRLQVLVDEAELRDLQRIAKRRRMTVAEWVRQALRAARRAEATGDASKKLEAVRQALRHEFPAGSVEDMLEEIERGYLPDGGRR